MQFLNRLICVTSLFSLTLGCKVENQSSGVKEFEFSSDICADLQKATDTRWNASAGTSKAQYHAQLVASERQVLDYELPRYRQRLNDMQTNNGPANGPGGKDIPLPNTPDKSTPDDPSKAVAPVAPTSTGQSEGAIAPVVGANPSAVNQGGLGLQNPSQSSTATALQACPGCSLQEVESRLRLLEQNKTRIASCQFNDNSVSTQTGVDPSDPEAGLTAQQKADRANSVNQIKDLILGASNAKALCEWWGTVSSGTGANRDRCQRESITGFCQAALSSAGSVTTGVINESSDGKIVADVAKTIPGAVKTAMIGCVQQLAYDTVKDALRNAGTRQFLPDATKQLAKDAIDSDGLSQQARAEKAAQLKKEIALLICKAGTSLVASQIEAEPQINYDHPCRAIFATSKSRARACLNTTGSACKIAAGDIDLANFLPEGAIDDKPVAALVTEAGNVIAGAACQAGGKVSSAACATISEAAAQIRSAITSGNNDWAHCLGTDQAGACTGTVVTEYMLGVKVADFKEPIRATVPSETPGYFEKDVCWCYYSCYQDDWGSNKELHKSNYYTLISNGAAGERDCTRQDGRWNWTGDKSKEGYHLYWKKHDCSIYRARSRDNEGFASSGGFEVNINGRWVYKNMTATSGSCPSGI